MKGRTKKIVVGWTLRKRDMRSAKNNRQCVKVNGHVKPSQFAGQKGMDKYSEWY